MEAIDTGFSAPDQHGQPPSLPPPIIEMANGIMAQNAQMFGEAPAPPLASDQAGVSNAPSPDGEDEGVGNAAGGAPGRPQQGRRVFTCKKCGQAGHMAKTCKAPRFPDSASAPPPRRRGRGGGVVQPVARPASVPYQEDEEGDIIAEDADDIHIEIESYKFQDGDFVWREVDVPSVAAAAVERGMRSGSHVYAERDLPPFKLGAAKCKNIKNETKTAWDYLGLLLDEDLILMLVCCTNEYARKSAYKLTRRGKKWRDCDEAEMRLFLAVVCYMGVVRVPSRRHIFDPQSIYGQEWIFSKMSRARFDALSRCLHSDSPWEFPPQEREEKNKRDPFWQTDAFSERLSDNFSRYWTLGQCADLDECTCGFRGKHKCRCFNPAKPHKYHFKMFCWNCSETGYCFAFYWYRGKEEARPAHVPATLWPVMKLVAKVVAAQPRVERNGFVLTTDNWYTSLHSALFLAQHGIHCCGTLRANRVTSAAPPPGALFKKSGAPPRGTIKCHALEGRLVPPNWKLFLTAWVDNKPVHMLHSWPTMFDTCERNQKQQGGQEYRKQQFPRPTICKNYNKSMGGTDLADFYLAEYATSHRAKRWQPKILFHCIQQAVVNAHILCCSKNGVTNAQFPLLMFITQLLEEIAPKPAPPAVDPCGYQPGVMSSRNRSWWNNKIKLRTEGRHFPDKFSNPQPQALGQKRESNCRKCIYCCDKQVLTFCNQCGVYLCLGRCFHLFHTLHDLDTAPENVANASSSSSNDSD
jgi:hypothetical protein